MFDVNELIGQLKISQNNPQAMQTIKNLQSFMNTQQGKNLANNLSGDNANEIKKAAAAMQKGDKAAAMTALNQILSTEDGRKLAMQLKNMLGK